MYEIIFYSDRNGKSEVYEYIKKLNNEGSKDSKIKLNKIIAYINQLSKHGISIGQPYIKYIDKNIWELRPLRDRILFSYLDNNKFILLSQFMKQTNKTPKREIEKAKRLLIDYKDREDDKDEQERFNLG